MQMERVAWLATWSRVRVGSSKNVFPTKEAMAEATTAALVQALADDDLAEVNMEPRGGAIVGAARARLRARVHALTLLAAHEREQFTFWTSFLQAPLEGSCYIFDVMESFLLARSEDVQQCSAAKRRGSVIALEEGQAERLVRQWVGDLPQWIQENPPGIMIRLPGAHAVLAGCGTWPSFLLVHCPITVVGGAHAMTITGSCSGSTPPTYHALRTTWNLRGAKYLSVAAWL